MQGHSPKKSLLTAALQSKLLVPAPSTESSTSNSCASLQSSTSKYGLDSSADFRNPSDFCLEEDAASPASSEDSIGKDTGGPRDVISPRVTMRRSSSAALLFETPEIIMEEYFTGDTERPATHMLERFVAHFSAMDVCTICKC